MSFIWYLRVITLFCWMVILCCLQIDWMDTETKEAARRKAHGITEHIGYPSELTDKSKLEELYHGLELNSTHFLGNALNMTVFGTNYAFSKLREKASKKHFPLSPLLNRVYLRPKRPLGQS